MKSGIDTLRLAVATAIASACLVPFASQAEERVAEIKMFAPENGHRVGVGGFGWFINLEIEFDVPLERTGLSVGNGFHIADGRLPINNNTVENTIRPIALGKKNWLFAGSERAGKRAAAIQTLLGTAKLNGLDPAAWLRDTLERLPTYLNSQIDSLLPLRAEPLLQTTP